MNKIALVTGGTKGIGKGIVLTLADNGYTVIANYHKDDESAKKLSHPNVETCKFDVSDELSCQTNIASLLQKHSKIDLLVNNAGITNDKMMHRMTSSQWHSVINTNLNSCFYVTRAIINSMRDNKFGRIVNISSINAWKGQMGQANYAASKAAIIGFTKSLAQENAIKNITVNAICPGYCETEMLLAIPQNILDEILKEIPVGRFGKPEDIARTVLFLADEKSSFITGAALDVNGGHYM